MVFNSNNPRASGGDTINFGSAKQVADGATATIAILNFKDTPSASGTDVDMCNIDFSVEFSNGSAVTFNSGS